MRIECMMHVAVVVLACFLPIAASADEIWTCTYPGFSKDRAPVIVRYREKGDFMLDDQFQQQYRILKNNQYALIAAWSFAEIEGTDPTPHIGAQTFVIDKANGAMLWSNTVLGHPDTVNAPNHGTCIRG